MRLQSLTALLFLFICGCGSSGEPYDPFMQDLEIVESSNGLDEKQAASQRIANQYVPDEAIDRMLVIVKDESEDETVRQHLASALGKMEPDRGNRLVVDLVEIANSQPSDSPLAKTARVAAERLSQDATTSP